MEKDKNLVSELRRCDHPNRYGIGVGAVVAHIAWIREDGAKREEVISGLEERFDTCYCSAWNSVVMAKICGVVYEKNDILYIRPRPK